MKNSNKENYCILYIVRHAETDWNAQGLVQGHSDTALNSVGESQAKDLAISLRNVKFDAVFSSDLLRAKRTAEVIVAERKLAVETTKILRERMWGRLEGQPVKRLRELEKIFTTLEEKQIFSYRHYPEIESDEEIYTRLITFIREVAVVYKGKTILVATHGGIIRAFLLRLGFFTYAESSSYVISNTSYVKISSDGVDFFIKETKGIIKKLPKT